MPKHYQTYTNSGVDVATNRADDLDRLCLADISVLNAPAVMDLGCGLGGQSLRLIKSGARVTAIDSHDFSSVFSDHLQLVGVNQTNLKFILADMRDLPRVLVDQNFDATVIQRTLHYLPYLEAYQLLKFLSTITNGRLYLSVMNIDAEAGDGYPGESFLEDRFASLSKSNQTKYSIFNPVCLYRQSEIEGLLLETGWQVEKIWQSAFGNIKLVAKNLPQTEGGR